MNLFNQYLASPRARKAIGPATTGALFAVAIAGFGAVAAPAEATIMTATYTGTVSNGVDKSNSFGLGSSLSGDAFTAVYTYDTSLGNRTSAGPGWDEVQGGTDFAFSPPITDAALTIGGTTVHFASASTGRIITQDGVGGLTYGNAQSHTLSGGVLFDQALTMRLNTVFATNNIEQNFSDSGSGTGSFGMTLIFPGVYTFFYGDLVTNHVTITGGFNAGVPEPTTWTMMLVGFGGLGAVLRRRRVALAA